LIWNRNASTDLKSESNDLCHHAAHSGSGMWRSARLSNAVSTDFILPLTTSVARKHAVVASSSGKSIQLCTFSPSIVRYIPLEHVTGHEIYVECNHGSVRDTNRSCKTI
jgi:hypothetical protein